MDKVTVKCGEIKESYAKLSPKSGNKEAKTNFNQEKGACKTQNLYILLVFLLITIALLIAASIYCYLIKYRAKQKKIITISRHKIKTSLY